MAPGLRFAYFLAIAAACSILSGCGPSYLRTFPGGGGDTQRVGDPANIPGMPNVNDLMARQRLMQELASDPDLPAWHDQREKMALALGDRVFDKGFDRTFDSMIIALANLGCRVNNMERVSGYITSSLPQLPPAQADALRQESLSAYAQAKGYSPSVLESKNALIPDFSGMMDKMNAGVTLTMIRQGAAQTKVKLRFNNIYYPPAVEELYKRVWDAVDKQIFLDKTLG